MNCCSFSFQWHCSAYQINLCHPVKGMFLVMAGISQFSQDTSMVNFTAKGQANMGTKQPFFYGLNPYSGYGFI